MGCLADPPYIEDSGQPEELLLTPGTPLELLCDARGTPAPNITWHKDGRALSRPEDGRGARRVLRMEGVQVRLPQLPRAEAAEGRAGPSSTRQGSAKLHFCLGCEDMNMILLAQGHALGNPQSGLTQG